MSVLHVCMVTKNRSISATTLHTAMNIHMLCMQRQQHLEIHFLDDRTQLPKIIKTGDRIFFMDYGTNLNNEILSKVVEPFDKGVQVLVFPSVKEGIDWKMFEKKTKEGSTEPAGQRGLQFDTEVGRKLADGLYECKSTSARVWAMDSKAVDKKLRGGKELVKLPVEGSPELMFRTLQNIGIKIGVMSEAVVVCHYTHECFGNILEASGVHLEP